MRSASSSNQDLHTLPIHALLPRYTWLTLFSIWLMWAIFVLLLFMVFPSSKANAQSFKNNHSLPVIVIWRAAGCKGVANGVTLVCSSITVYAGKTVGYQFKPGTSYRQIRLKGPANCNARGNVDAPADDAVSIDGSCDIMRYSFTQGDSTLTIRNLKTELVNPFTHNTAIPPTLPFSKGGAERGFKLHFASNLQTVLPFEKGELVGIAWRYVLHDDCNL